MGIDERAFLLEDAPDTYYVTDYYSKYPVVLARLSELNHDAVHDLLAGSRTLALEKVAPHRLVRGQHRGIPRHRASRVSQRRSVAEHVVVRSVTCAWLRMLVPAVA